MHTIDATYQTEFSFLSYLFVRVNGEMRIMKEKRKEENEILILFLLLFVVGWLLPSLCCWDMLTMLPPMVVYVCLLGTVCRYRGEENKSK